METVHQLRKRLKRQGYFGFLILSFLVWVSLTVPALSGESGSSFDKAVYLDGEQTIIFAGSEDAGFRICHDGLSGDALEAETGLCHIVSARLVALNASTDRENTSPTDLGAGEEDTSTGPENEDWRSYLPTAEDLEPLVDFYERARSKLIEFTDKLKARLEDARK